MKLRLPKPARLFRCVIAVVGVLSLLWFAVPFLVPLPASLLDNPIASPVVVDRHGAPIVHLTLADSTRSTPVSLSEFPEDLIACTVTVEDKRFEKHGGLDLLATCRALRDLLVKRRVVSGASTITQQLIKISSPRTQRNATAKLREAIAARHLEMIWPKDRILTAYLNRLDYGNLRTGSTEAARFYFQKPLADLSLAECALLAGIPQAPSRLNPLRHPQRALDRRNVVLQRLAASGRVDATRIASAMAEPLNLRPLDDEQPAPWLAALTPAPSSQLRIHTTLDLTIQRDIEAIVTMETARLRSANLRHAAVVVIHNATGEIIALVSSANWHDPRGGQINGALAPRSPGTTLKPFTYLLAMERGQRTPTSILADIPSPFRTPQGLSLPENYDRAYRGPVTLRSALACSLNVPAMRELNALGGPAPLHELLSKLGLTTLGNDPDAYGLGLTIGNAPARLLEVTNAYATLARSGRHQPPVLFPAETAPPSFDLPFSASSFYLIADILADSAARAPSFTPGGPLDLPFRCAVKTGTSSDFRDNWCVGFTAEFTVGVWAGNFENQPMKGISGVAGAAPIFHRAMLRMHRDHLATWLTKPDSLRPVTIDVRNGKITPPDSANPYARQDWVPPEKLPQIATADDYDKAGKSLLEPAYAAWFDSSQNLRRHELALDPTPLRNEPLHIITPANDAVFLLDPEIPSGSERLRPVTNLPGTARWSSATLRIQNAAPEPVIHLTPGTHTLTATDPRTNTAHTITLHVKQM